MRKAKKSFLYWKQTSACNAGRKGTHSSSSSSSSSPDIIGNGPAPCLGASLRPVVWLASRESEEGSSQVIEPAQPSLPPRVLSSDF
uniref:Uncharacterized protein n=1 Tax=Nothobranchius furzeri TaxID=105023 RepID=A0A1A8UUI0_NOTFU